jgi:REP element-mobilizing transposase RayT
MDRILDHARCGPSFLRRPEIAALFINALFDGQHRFRRYEVHAFVVMSNHVHLLVTPSVPGRVWLRSLKGFTGYEAIRLLGLGNTPFWQDDNYDHLVRNREEFTRVRRYIEWNPVKAGVAQSPENFPWSSAAWFKPVRDLP